MMATAAMSPAKMPAVAHCGAAFSPTTSGVAIPMAPVVATENRHIRPVTLKIARSIVTAVIVASGIVTPNTSSQRHQNCAAEHEHD